jgi:hypothetical protein
MCIQLKHVPDQAVLDHFIEDFLLVFSCDLIFVIFLLFSDTRDTISMISILTC